MCSSRHILTRLKQNVITLPTESFFTLSYYKKLHKSIKIFKQNFSNLKVCPFIIKISKKKRVFFPHNSSRIPCQHPKPTSCNSSWLRFRCNDSYVKLCFSINYSRKCNNLNRKYLINKN